MALRDYGDMLRFVPWARVNGVRRLFTRFDPAACAKALAAQLGPRWEGLDAAPPHVRCLALQLGAMASADPDTRQAGIGLAADVARVLVATGAGSERDGKLTSLTVPLAANGGLVDAIEATAARHAYVATAMVSLKIWAARECGQVPATLLSWVEVVDRPLSRVLRNVGFVAFTPEGLGAMAHHDAEMEARAPIAEPALAKAVEAMAAL